MPIPDFLNSMLQKQYGPELAARIVAGYACRRPVTLRVNTLKSSAEKIKEALTQAGISYREVSWNRDALILENVREQTVQELEIYTRGEIYLQSLSSMIPPILLAPCRGESILDMAAAPGGKTTQMAALTEGRAQITACEKNKIRADRLKFNLDRQGAGKVFVMETDARKLDPLFSFDKILLDAPCSGSGTLFWSEEAAPDSREAAQNRRTEQYFTPELISRSVRTQEALLRKALELLKPGHEMVYSTCSILEAENEGLLKKILPRMRSRIVPIEHPMLSVIPLLPTGIEGVCCVCPTQLYEGFFAAKIRKE